MGRPISGELLKLLGISWFINLDGFSKRCLLKLKKKGLVLSQKRPTSNERNVGLPAPNLMRFSSK